MQKRQCNVWLRGVLFLGVLLVGALSALPAQAVSANGPYYPTPSWDLKLPTEARFVVLLNWNSEAVLDRETGLVWARSPETPVIFPWGSGNGGAAKFCANRIRGERKGWRLPSVVELTSLIDRSIAFPGVKLPSGHPFTNVQSGDYWSATTAISSSSSFAWSVDFSSGGATALSKTLSLLVWCVRGGMNADVY